MVQIIRMPEVLAGTASAGIQTWMVTPGATITTGQTLAEIETDKAVIDFAAETDGVVGRLLAAEGDTVAVGAPIVVLIAEGDGAAEIDAALAAEGAADASRAESAVTASTTDATRSAAVPEEAPERRFVSPLVRRLAREKGVDLALISGTGPNGRIVRRDLDRHLAAAPPSQEPATASAAATAQPLQACETAADSSDAGDFEDVPIDRMRRAIARRLTESKSSVPHFYLVAECRVDALLALRAQVNTATAHKVSVNDFVVGAVGRALADVPAMNAIWNEDSIRRFSAADVSVAVSTDGGLLTPVIRGVDRLSLSQIRDAVVDLAERARSGRLRQHELEGGSFTVSNLGMHGVSEFSAIINPPQSGILAVGAAARVPIVRDDGGIGVGTVMKVTLSADHRVVDGAVAAQWLAAFQRRIENPLSVLV